MDSTTRNAKNMTAQQIAKAIREALKAAVKAGALPKATYFVRQSWSGYTPSIHITVKGWKGQVFNEGWLEHVFLHSECPRHINRDTPEATALLKAAEKIANQWNFDESMIEHDLFSVGYYLHADFDRKAVREAEAARWGFARTEAA